MSNSILTANPFFSVQFGSFGFDFAVPLFDFVVRNSFFVLSTHFSAQFYCFGTALVVADSFL
jgi:hypothetical protein